ncbi:Gldg family protein [Dolichospermum circinale CS-545/17]|nr:Gldg family protein [Dolichospermum circinale CS-545/17]
MTKNKLWKLIFWLGPFFITAGLTVRLTSVNSGIIPLSLIIIGLVICALWVVQTKWWQKRSTQSTTNALIATLSVLVILGLINFLGIRYHLRLDLTDTQLFTLSPQSRELVSNLPETMKVWLFTKEKNSQDQELLDNYHRQSNKFKFEYVDPELKPGLAERFGVKDYGEVYLEFQTKRQLIQIISEDERLSEIKLTNRLQQMINPKTAKVYFLQGHSEHPLSASKGAISKAIQGLTDKNFTISTLNLAERPQVPDDANVVIVAGPQKELLTGEVTALQNYLNRGGNLLLMIDPNTNPKMDTLLKEWGVRLDNRLVIDNSGASLQLGPATILVTEYGQHPITQDFANNISVYPLTRPLEIDPVSGVESMVLLKTKPYPNSWAESDQKSEKLEFNEDKDLKGPLTLGVALTRKLLNSPIPTDKTSPTPIPTTKTSPNTAKESRLVVFGNSNFATDSLFEQQLNGDVFLNTVSWLSQQDEKLLSIRPKQPKNRRIIISNLEANLLTISAVFLLPLLGLLTGFIIWWKRR